MRIVICGAAGRDFHDFLVLYREDPQVQVVAFTATQIPYIDQRRFPAELAGPRYPQGIPILPEEGLAELVQREAVDQVVFAYSDVRNEHVMRRGAIANAAGADLVVPGARTMVPAEVPVISICAVRTGCGKSQTSRWLLDRLRASGRRVVALRHPMPYGDLLAQRVQRFAHRDHLVEQACTIEEREEYEPYIEAGHVVYAGVDYQAIVAQAASEAELLLWDGGNNDLPLVRPDLHIVLLDAHRPGDALRYYPSEAQLRLADIVLVAKADTARPEDVQAERELAAQLCPGRPVIAVGSRLELVGTDEEALRGRRVVCVEDGPTSTHGGMAYGAATLLARRAGATIVDPRPAFVGELRRAHESYPELGPVVPALGYSPQQLADLQATLQAVDAELVLNGSPIALHRLVQVDRPMHRVRYDLELLPGEADLGTLIDEALTRLASPRDNPHRP